MCWLRQNRERKSEIVGGWVLIVFSSVCQIIGTLPDVFLLCFPHSYQEMALIGNFDGSLWPSVSQAALLSFFLSNRRSCVSRQPGFVAITCDSLIALIDRILKSLKHCQSQTPLCQRLWQKSWLEL